MKTIIVDKCAACNPINRLINQLNDKGIEVVESKLEDYHFHQLYFKINASIEVTNDMSLDDLTKRDNFIVCDCHWSRVEFLQSLAIEL
ncbi:MAG: hypothetical protein NZ529_04605 [Cytophagaceae bacterium]|nr:hypothetical protein [Cytophagaceae bacterium]MDW8456056.1 hypothetical protein [Cytophagaceae bacterium]